MNKHCLNCEYYINNQCLVDCNWFDSWKEKKFCSCKNRSMQLRSGNLMYCLDCELPVKN